MAGFRIPGLCAALFFCLAGGGLSARTFTIPIPHPAAKTIFYTTSVSASAGWEVAVRLDESRCELHCSYRRKPGAAQVPLLARLLPPVTTIHIYEGAAAKPITVSLDPAGMRQPSIAARIRPWKTSPYLPTKRLAPVNLSDGIAISAMPAAIFPSGLDRTISRSASPLPLRI